MNRCPDILIQFKDRMMLLCLDFFSFLKQNAPHFKWNKILFQQHSGWAVAFCVKVPPYRNKCSHPSDYYTLCSQRVLASLEFSSFVINLSEEFWSLNSKKSFLEILQWITSSNMLWKSDLRHPVYWKQLKSLYRFLFSPPFLLKTLKDTKTLKWKRRVVSSPGSMW